MKLKINLRFWALFFGILLFFKPLAINSLQQYAQIDKFWDIGRILVCAYVFYSVVVKEKKISKCCLYIVLLELVFLFSTLIYNGDVKGLIVQGISIISFCLLISSMAKKDLLTLCKAMFYSLSTLILIHFIFSILYPEGLGYDLVYYNTIYFLGGKNGLIKFIFPAIISGLIMSDIENKKIEKKVLFMILISIYICIDLDSTTSVIGILVALIIDLLASLEKFKIKFYFQKIFFILFIATIVGTIIEINGGFISVLKTFVDERKLSNYIERINIWNKSIQKIEESPIIGYGNPINGGHIMINTKPMYAHNGFLEILLYGGFLGFIVFVVILKKFLFGKNRYIDKQIIYVASGIVSFLVMMLTETHINTISFWAFIVLYDTLINKNASLTSAEIKRK